MNLFEINEQIEKAILDSVDEETGEITDLSLVDNLQLELQEKVKNIVLYIKWIEAKNNAIKIEQDRLKAMGLSNVNHIDNLKNYLLQGMKISKIDKFDFDTFKVGIRNNPPRMILSNDLKETLEEDIKVVEMELKDEKAAYADIKKEFKDKLKKGEEVKGAYLEVIQSISIK